jgi:hypothetical protein
VTDVSATGALEELERDLSEMSSRRTDLASGRDGDGCGDSDAKER